MKPKTLFIVRGLPGSGKSTFASYLDAEVWEADQFFQELDGYKFDPSRLKEAHAWCRDGVRQEMELGTARIAVANTSTQKWEYEPYLELAKEFGYRVFVITVEGDHGNIHDVPEDAIARMHARWEAHT